MNRKTRVLFIVFCLMLCFLIMASVALGISTTSKVQITDDGQVVDSILYNNILTQAIYTPKANVASYNTDPTYCCAALVKRFYSNVYGVTVYGLLSPTSVPVVTAGSFTQVTSPKPGDIVRFTNYTHWAIVKKIDNAGNVVLLEQNVWSGDSALVGRTIAAAEVSSADYTYFRYSTSDSAPAVVVNSAATTHVHSYKKKYAEAHPHQAYMVCACGDYYHIDEYGFSINCKECYNERYGDLADSTTASPNATTVKVNGTKVDFDAYNIGGNNFFKLRDLAYTINGTAKKFAVAWNNNLKSIALTSGSAYKANGTEMLAQGGQTVTADLSSSKLYLDNSQIYPLTYNVNNNNYVKLQDLALALDINVNYDAANKVITINTNKAY